MNCQCEFACDLHRKSSLLLFYNADTLFDMIAAYNLIDHSDRMICIADNTFALAVERQFLTVENVLASTLSVRLKITCGAKERTACQWVCYSFV